MLTDPLTLYNEKNNEINLLFEQIKIDIIQELLYNKYENMSIINDKNLLIFPEFFNIKNQTFRIINILENTTNLTEIKKILNKLITDKYLKYEKYNILINPQIINKLDEILIKLNEDFYG